jgi:hypothetical protein
MKTLLVSVLLTLFGHAAVAQNCYFEIRFRGGFDQDNVSFYVGKKAIFKDVSLSHSTVTDNTDIALLFTRAEDEVIVTNVFSEATHRIQPVLFFDKDWDGKFDCKVVINGKEYLFKVDVAKGHHMQLFYHPHEKEAGKVLAFSQGFVNVPEE